MIFFDNSKLFYDYPQENGLPWDHYFVKTEVKKFEYLKNDYICRLLRQY